MKKQSGANGVCIESRIMKRFFGVSLFICAAIFGQLFIALPLYVSIPSAVLYLFLQYKLWIK